MAPCRACQPPKRGADEKPDGATLGTALGAADGGSVAEFCSSAHSLLSQRTTAPYVPAVAFNAVSAQRFQYLHSASQHACAWSPFARGRRGGLRTTSHDGDDADARRGAARGAQTGQERAVRGLLGDAR